MAKNMNLRKLTAMLLTLLMLLNGFTVSASAATADAPEMVQNFAHTYYKQDGTAGSPSDWEIHLSKTAAATATDNVFDITLGIETKDITMQTTGATHGATVLVLDVSNSMNEKISKKSSTTQLDLLKDAVGKFLDTYAQTTAEGDKRLVAVAVFGTNAITIQKWVDVTNAKALASLKAEIDSLSTGSGAYQGDEYLCRGGTNLEAGLVLARNLLKQSTELAGIPAANRSMVLFSDGDPSAAVGSVNNQSVTEVKYDGGDTGTETNYKDYDNVAGILAQISATKIAVRYNYTDGYNLLNTKNFTRVIASSADTLTLDLTAEAGNLSTSLTMATMVTDPMGTGVSIVGEPAGYDAAAKAWDLSKFTPVVADGITTYTITYQVQLDPEAVEADPLFPGYTVLTPANGATVLNYTFGEEEIPVAADFNEPNIRGILSFTVSYEYEGEVPADAPALPASAEYKAGAAVTVADAPELAGYTFSGWDKVDFTMPAQDVVIYGSWTLIPVTEPEVTEPEVTEPEVTEPEVTEPEVTEPEVTEPEVTEPEVTEPEVTEPEVTEPEVTEPEVTEPEVTEPEVTEPEVTEPEVTEPEVTEPEVTEPEVTEPEVTEPEVTEPEVTEPEVTEPEVTEPEVTEPEVTEPEVTEPEVTEPEVTEPEEEIDIPDDPVPLAPNPKTGDPILVFVGTGVASLVGMIGLAALGKKKTEETEE